MDAATSTTHVSTHQPGTPTIGAAGTFETTDSSSVSSEDTGGPEHASVSSLTSSQTDGEEAFEDKPATSNVTKSPPEPLNGSEAAAGVSRSDSHNHAAETDHMSRDRVDGASKEATKSTPREKIGDDKPPTNGKKALVNVLDRGTTKQVHFSPSDPAQVHH